MNTLIISGGSISIEFLKNYLSTHTYDCLIAVDKGLEVLYSLGIIPNHIVGDFDSVSANVLNYYQLKPDICIHSYCPEKDATDTEIAITLAIHLKSSHISILGAIGTRMDHTLANLHLLTLPLKSNIPCQLLNETNKIQLLNSSITLTKENAFGKYVSIIPLTTWVKGLTLSGFKYPLSNYSLSIGNSLGISNEIVEPIATISLQEGLLLLIQSKD